MDRVKTGRTVSEVSYQAIPGQEENNKSLIWVRSYKKDRYTTCCNLFTDNLPGLNISKTLLHKTRLAFTFFPLKTIHFLGNISAYLSVLPLRKKLSEITAFYIKTTKWVITHAYSQ